MTIQTDLRTYLLTQSDLMALLTGGLHTDTTISRQNTPTAFDSTTRELKTCALMRTAMETPIRPYARGARTFVTFYLYQLSGFDSIRSASEKLFDALHEKTIGSKTWSIVSTGTSGELRDEALDCNLITCDFQITRMK